MDNLKLFIYGCGGFGREVLELARQINKTEHKWKEIHFVDDHIFKKEINGAKVFPYESVKKIMNKEFIIATGEPEIKRKLYIKLKNDNQKLATLIHPSVTVSSYNTINEGGIICEGSILTTNIIVGICVIININCTIGHDCSINDFTTVSPGCNISGGVEIGKATYIGSGTNVRDEIIIGNQTIVGIGSLITKDIPDGVIVFGVPAKIESVNDKRKVF